MSKNIRIRMYDVGFGDFFLVSFPNGRQMLVDCGVHMGGNKGTIQACVEDMKIECGGHLNVVVATHYHADHISGFDTASEIFSGIEVDEVWMPYLMNQEEPMGAALRAMEMSFARALASAARPEALEFEKMLQTKADAYDMLIAMAGENGPLWVEGEMGKYIPPSLPGADGVPGKRGDIPNPFRAGGSLPNGTKVWVSDNMIPHTVPFVKEEQLSENASMISMTFDVEHEIQMKEALFKKIIKTLRKSHAEWSEDELDTRTKEYVEAGLKQAQKIKDDSMISYEFTVDIDLIEREYVKIAYEMAFRQFGYAYLESSQTASILREALKNNISPGEHYVQLLPAESPFGADVSDPLIHFVGLCGNQAWIRIAGICGYVIFEEQNANFMIPNGKQVLETFDTRPQD